MPENIKLALSKLIYKTVIFFLYPVNYILSISRKSTVYKNSVLHISYMVHIPYCMVRILRKHGIRADFMAVSDSSVWDKSDYRILYSGRSFVRAFQEFVCFWKIVAKYQVIHSHFMFMLTQSGWELQFIKKMGRIIVIHYRGCEIRERTKNMQIYPDVNICQECDYYLENEKKYYCESDAVSRKKSFASKFGDLFLVTTPDMIDFCPEAIHIPFFAPDVRLHDYPIAKTDKSKSFKIVHVTNHQGIEGTSEIKRTIENLITKGYKINFVFLKDVSNDVVLKELYDADLSIGKMKMGYYANAQIESMLMGVPAVTYVRPEFMTEELKRSGFIFTDLSKLEETLKYYLDNPDKLEEKRKIAGESILALHDNDKLAKRLIGYYQNLTKKKSNN